MISEKGIEESPAFLKDDLEYFNLEVSPEGTTLVFNASKKGLDTFLQTYSILKSPPEYVSFKGSSRPTRIWLSWEVKENDNISPKDPSPYEGVLNTYVYNDLVHYLYFRLVEGQEDYPILSAGIERDHVFLFINKKGWRAFIKLLQCLRDKSYWFYLTPPNPKFTGKVLFQLTTSYLGNTENHIFKALEFIRLEPEEEIYLRSDPWATFTANSAGWLFLAQRLRNFANNEETSWDICLSCNLLPKILNSGSSNNKPPSWLYLRKVEIDHSYPIFSFKKANETSVDLYIFGNHKGFYELADIAEKSAFYSDHDDFYKKQSPMTRCEGDILDTKCGPDDLYSLDGWGRVGGGLFNPKYNPLRFIDSNANPSAYSSDEDIIRNFVNERMWDTLKLW